MEHPKPILDYSSPAQEQSGDWWTEEQIRRDAAEACNRTAVGNRRPIAFRIWLFALFTALTVAAFLLPYLRH